MIVFDNPFESEEFKKLSSKEKVDFILNEFLKCKKDIEYFMNNYVYVRHANIGVLKFKPFDFQLDLAKHISTLLIYGKTEEGKKIIKEYKHSFNYKKWLEEVIEKFKMEEKVPHELKLMYEYWITQDIYKELFDIIILKSRQVGASTLFSIITAWYTNFFSNVVSLIVSQRDKEAIKFLHDVKMIYKFIPSQIRAKQLKDNDHELFVSIDGKKERQSIAQAFPPTPDAGRGYSPNMIILDEFASYKKAEELMTAITFAVSTGGIIVILSTPKGVGNLFYKLWIESVRNISILKNVDLNSLDKDIQKRIINSYKPYVIHWSQLPLEEFQRRGFDNPLDWYESMAKKILSENGEKAVAQELDLEFLTSGDTFIDGKTLKQLSHKIIKTFKPIIKNKEDEEILKILTNIYKVKVIKLPEENKTYIFGIDTSEGVGKDYSVIYCFELNEINLNNLLQDNFNNNLKTYFPQIVFYFYSNKIDTKTFAGMIVDLAKIYNNAFIHIEKNNTGLAVIDYLSDNYYRYKILNTYRPNKTEDKIFDKNSKGWDTKQNTRTLLLNTTYNFIKENLEDIQISQELYQEFTTFINTGKKYEAMQNFHR